MCHQGTNGPLAFDQLPPGCKRANLFGEGSGADGSVAESFPLVAPHQAESVPCNQIFTSLEGFCLPCPRGQETNASLLCEDCLPGMFSNDGLLCRYCPQGMEPNDVFQADGLERFTGRKLCAKRDPSTASLSHPLGRCIQDAAFTQRGGATDCLPCVEGTYSADGKKCLECPGSFYVNDEQTGCLPVPSCLVGAPVGTYSPDNGKTCLLCPDGTEVMVNSAETCTDTVEGEVVADCATTVATCTGTATDTTKTCSALIADATNCGAEAGCTLNPAVAYVAGTAAIPSTTCPATVCTLVNAAVATCSGTATDTTKTCSTLTADATNCGGEAGCTMNAATGETCTDTVEGEVVADCATGYTVGDARYPSTTCPATICTQVDAVAAASGCDLCLGNEVSPLGIQCRACSPGTQPNDATAAWRGDWRRTRQTLSRTDCVSCEEVSLAAYSTDGVLCVDCELGKEPNWNRTECFNCTDDQLWLSGDCQDCPSGTEPNPNGFPTPRLVCRDCLPGYAGNNGVCALCKDGKEPTADRTACGKCEAGTTSDETRLLALGFCPVCPAGRASDANGEWTAVFSPPVDDWMPSLDKPRIGPVVPSSTRLTTMVATITPVDTILCTVTNPSSDYGSTPATCVATDTTATCAPVAGSWAIGTADSCTSGLMTGTCAVTSSGTNADCGAATTATDCTAATGTGGASDSANDCVYTATATLTDTTKCAFTSGDADFDAMTAGSCADVNTGTCAVTTSGANTDCGAATTAAACTAATTSGGASNAANDCVFTATATCTYVPGIYTVSLETCTSTLVGGEIYQSLLTPRHMSPADYTPRQYPDESRLGNLLQDRTECKRCEAGKYSEDGVRCRTCEPGYMVTEPTRNNCTACELGKYSPDGSDCVFCIPGEEMNAPLAATGCLSCALHWPDTSYYSKMGPVIGALDASYPWCSPCIPGTTPNEDLSDCRPCPTHMAGPAGQCAFCPSGTRPTTDRVSCRLCPFAHAGQSGKCELCPDGFQPNTDRTGCLQCPPGRAGRFGRCNTCGVGAVPIGWQNCSDSQFNDEPTCLAASGSCEDPRFTTREDCLMHGSCCITTVVEGVMQTSSCLPISGTEADCQLPTSGLTANRGAWARATLHWTQLRWTSGNLWTPERSECASCAPYEYGPDGAECMQCGAGYQRQSDASVCEACGYGTYAHAIDGTVRLSLSVGATGVFKGTSGSRDTVDVPDSCTSTIQPKQTLFDTEQCTLTGSLDFGVTPGTCADRNITATCMYVVGEYLATTPDTVDRHDSCTSTRVSTVTPVDSSNCFLSPSRNFGVSAGSCTKQALNAALTCAYVGGAYSASGNLDTVDVPDTCTSTIVATGLDMLDDTQWCQLTTTPDFGVTDGTCAWVNYALARCAYVQGSFSASNVLDTVDISDSCTSTTIEPPVRRDTTNCVLTSGNADFDATTKGSCADADSAYATCVYADGAYSAQIPDVVVTPDSCSSTLVATNLLSDTTNCNLTTTADWGFADGACEAVINAVDAEDSCTSTVVVTVTEGDTTHCDLTTANMAATCTGTATIAAATCIGTDSTDQSDCAVNVAWTGGDQSVGTCATGNGCAYGAAVVPTCDLDGTTDSTAVCPAGCASTAAATVQSGVIDGSCEPDVNLVAATCTGTATATAAATCTGTDSTDQSDCAVNSAWTGGDQSVGTCATGNGCAYGAAVVPTCDLDGTTDSTAVCPAGCASTASYVGDSAATCAYVPGAYVDSDADNVLDAITTPDSCTSTLIATVTPTDTAKCVLAASTDFGATAGMLDTVEAPDSCTSTTTTTVTTSDTTACALTATLDFGSTLGSCADADSAVATCAYVSGTYSGRIPNVVDTVVTPDSCTSTTVTTVMTTDTTNCALSATADFGVTAGSCVDTDAAVATCAYVVGSFSASEGSCTAVDATTATCAYVPGNYSATSSCEYIPGVFSAAIGTPIPITFETLVRPDPTPGFSDAALPVRSATQEVRFRLTASARPPVHIAMEMHDAAGNTLPMERFRESCAYPCTRPSSDTAQPVLAEHAFGPAMSSGEAGPFVISDSYTDGYSYTHGAQSRVVGITLYVTPAAAVVGDECPTWDRHCHAVFVANLHQGPLHAASTQLAPVLHWGDSGQEAAQRLRYHPTERTPEESLTERRSGSGSVGDVPGDSAREGVHRLRGMACAQCPPGSQPNRPAIRSESQTDPPAWKCRRCAEWGPGYFSPDGVLCVTCPSGKYPTTDRSLCQPCAFSDYGVDGICHHCRSGLMPTPTQTGCVTCPPGHIGYEGECMRCGIGTSPNPTQRECNPCAPGHAGRQGFCSRCSQVPFATVPATATSRFIEPMVPGTMDRSNCTRCIDTYSEDGVTCKRCPWGYGINAQENGCYICPFGTVSVGSVSCVTCPPGFEVNAEIDYTFNSLKQTNGSTECRSCELRGRGYYSDDGVECFVCPAGSTPDLTLDCVTPGVNDWGSVYQGQDCPAGRASVAGWMPRSKCERCRDGTTNAGSPLELADKVCDICPDGQWSWASVTCEYCPENQAGLNGMCRDCNDGTMPSPEHTFCDACPAGRAGRNGYCDDCRPGYVPDALLFACETCAVAKGGDRCTCGSLITPEECVDKNQRRIWNQEDCEATGECIECAGRGGAVIGYETCLSSSQGQCSARLGEWTAVWAVPNPAISEYFEVNNTCHRCGGGTKPNVNGTACVPCPPGTAGVDGTCRPCRDWPHMEVPNELKTDCIYSLAYACSVMARSYADNKTWWLVDDMHQVNVAAKAWRVLPLTCAFGFTALISYAIYRIQAQLAWNRVFKTIAPLRGTYEHPEMPGWLKFLLWLWAIILLIASGNWREWLRRLRVCCCPAGRKRPKAPPVFEVAEIPSREAETESDSSEEDMLFDEKYSEEEQAFDGGGFEDDAPEAAEYNADFS